MGIHCLCRAYPHRTLESERNPDESALCDGCNWETRVSPLFGAEPAWGTLGSFPRFPLFPDNDQFHGNFAGGTPGDKHSNILDLLRCIARLL